MPDQTAAKKSPKASPSPAVQSTESSELPLPSRTSCEMAYTMSNQVGIPLVWDHRATLVEEPNWEMLQLEAEHSDQPRDLTRLSPTGNEFYKTMSWSPAGVGHLVAPGVHPYYHAAHLETFPIGEEPQNSDEGSGTSLPHSPLTDLQSSNPQQRHPAETWDPCRPTPHRTSSPQAQSLYSHPLSLDPPLQHVSHVFKTTVPEYEIPHSKSIMVPRMNLSGFPIDPDTVNYGETPSLASRFPLGASRSPIKSSFLHLDTQLPTGPAELDSNRVYQSVDIMLQQPNDVWKNSSSKSPDSSHTSKETGSTGTSNFVNYTPRDD